MRDVPLLRVGCEAAFDTEIGGFGGNVLPGVDPIVRWTADFEEAQEVTPFHLRAPGYLPDGDTLRGIKLAPGNAFLFYGGPGHDIILIQASVGPQPSDDPNLAVGVKTGWVTLDAGFETGED